MPPPKVFISYTHESQAHKDWTALLATRLRDSGVDVTLDQWELTLGTDLTLFMEKAIREADRVLLICTPVYREKANSATGGVGYERLIVTGELAHKLTTDKFICLLRAGDSSSALPSFALGRLFVDFRDDSQFDRTFNTLVRDLYRVPQAAKPPLGSPPAFAPAQAPAEPLRESGTWEDWHRLHFNKLVCLAPHCRGDLPSLGVGVQGIWTARKQMFHDSTEKIDVARSFEHSARVWLMVPECDNTGRQLMSEITVTKREAGAGAVTHAIEIGRGQYELEYSIGHFLRRVDGYETYEDGSRGFSILVPRRLKRTENAVSPEIREQYFDGRLTVNIMAWDGARSLDAIERKLLAGENEIRVLARQAKKYGTRQGTYVHATETGDILGEPVHNETHIALVPTATSIIAVQVIQHKTAGADASDEKLTDAVIRSLVVR